MGEVYTRKTMLNCDQPTLNHRQGSDSTQNEWQINAHVRLLNEKKMLMSNFQQFCGLRHFLDPWIWGLLLHIEPEERKRSFLYQRLDRETDEDKCLMHSSQGDAGTRRQLVPCLTGMVPSYSSTSTPWGYSLAAPVSVN